MDGGDIKTEAEIWDATFLALKMEEGATGQVMQWMWLQKLERQRSFFFPRTSKQKECHQADTIDKSLSHFLPPLLFDNKGVLY